MMKTTITWRRILLISSVFSIAFIAMSSHAEKFSFFAVGDTAYTETSYETYDGLIDAINKEKPAFTIHVGDTLGYQYCTDQTFDVIDGQFARFKKPVIYTPGDNEWTDCVEEGKRPMVDGYGWQDASIYKLNRLDEIRKRYFADNESLGQTKLKMVRQTDVPPQEHFESLPENRYWMKGGVLFATVHIVGSNDSLHPHEKLLIDESVNRRHAGFFWIFQLLQLAKEKDAKAVVIATHAEMFEREVTPPGPGRRSGTKIKGGREGAYVGYVDAMSNLAANFKGQVLLLHGDGHRFVIDRPLLINQYDSRVYLDNMMRVQVVGHPEQRAVRIDVDTDSEHIFSYSLF